MSSTGNIQNVKSNEWQRVDLKEQKKVGKMVKDNQSEYSDTENPFYEDKMDQPTMDTTKEIKEDKKDELMKQLTMEQIAAKTYTKNKLVYDSSKIASKLPIYFNQVQKHKN